MSKPARGSLSSLSSRLAPKGDTMPAIPALPEADDAGTPDATALDAGAPRDLKTMMCRVNRAGWSEMSKLAIDRDMNLEDMLIEACNDLLRQHDRPPVIEKRSPQARKPMS